VLVVDDEEFVRDLGKELLEELGFQCICACDGEDAVRQFMNHQNEIVCVLLDLTMPKMDGVATFKALRDINPDVRVILSSGYDEHEVTEKFAGAGLSGFVQKPYRFMELKMKLGAVLGS
jgi:two-component system, cell cycle sensor histidine kinase and response regulator CckA